MNLPLLPRGLLGIYLGPFSLGGSPVGPFAGDYLYVPDTCTCPRLPIQYLQDIT